MTGLSALTIVRNRTAHLLQLVEGLRRSSRQPDELVIVDMSDEAIPPIEAPFPVIQDRYEVDGLPLAAARNRAAFCASGENLIFLDVDCIPLRECLGSLEQTLAAHNALLCAEIRYLGPASLETPWTDASLLRTGLAHPVRSFPAAGVRTEANPGLFWSLGFAIRAETFSDLGGFDERFDGYGAEDTDFGFRAAENGLPLMFVGGAIACHQYHESYDPPLNHLADIVINARKFFARWGQWPMEGWLKKLNEMGLVRWQDARLELVRYPTPEDMDEAKVLWPGGLAPASMDHPPASTVLPS